MRWRMTPLRVRAALLAIAVGLSGLTSVQGQPVAPTKKEDNTSPSKKPSSSPPVARWTLEEALEQLNLYPRDPYLQYVALQLARREKQVEPVSRKIDQIVRADQRAADRRGRRDRVDLFSIFTGALAVQESLQLDTMRRATRGAAAGTETRKIVEVSTLTGPTIKSHPWKKMLAGKKPEVDPLARMVPADQYFISFRSVNKMLEVLDSTDLWGTHLFNQTSQQARSQQVGERVQQQLAIETNRFLRPVYDAVVEEVAVTGNDLYVAEGSDITLLFRIKNADLFKPRMDGFLANAQGRHKDAQRSEGNYRGVSYVHVTTPERQVHVYSAYPQPNLHVRSNSRVAFERIIDAIQGKTQEGKPVARLGDSDEFKYIRTLMPRGAKEEDGFIYFSDPFIRRIVGPVSKLSERRRMLCYNHLRMIGHASLLFQTEHGRPPKSLDELYKAGCLPGEFNEGYLTCLAGGTYKLSADGHQGYCTAHGHAHALNPCCEMPVSQITDAEAQEYRAFVEDYNRYWRTFFDPIAVRIQATPQRYRLETIVLPLINNSIYQGLAMALGGEPEPLDALPVPARNIFSVGARFNKEALMKQMGVQEATTRATLERDLANLLNVPAKDVRNMDVARFLSKGLGNQVGLHIYDAEPLLDLNVIQFLGLMFGEFGWGRRVDSEEVLVSFMVTSFTAPVYISLPVQDARVVDEFLERLDQPLARVARQPDSNGWFRFGRDFYKAKLKNGATMRSFVLEFGPVKIRSHWARIGNGLYIASKPFILDDLAVAHAAQERASERKTDPETRAHALITLRPQHWDQVLPGYRLGWAENNREACLANLGPLASAGRAFPGKGKQAQRFAEEFYAVRFFCPEGGHYFFSEDGKGCSCSVHGSALEPRQQLAPQPTSSTALTVQRLAGAKASLTFLEDGLHAVLILDRR
jgi:hypothetical protein